MDPEESVRPCCSEATCPLEEISLALDPDDPLPERIRFAACKIAETCGKLSASILRQCFPKIFEAPSECRLCDEFVLAYQTERDGLEGKRDIDGRRGSAG